MLSRRGFFRTLAGVAGAVVGIRAAKASPALTKVAPEVPPESPLAQLYAYGSQWFFMPARQQGKSWALELMRRQNAKRVDPPLFVSVDEAAAIEKAAQDSLRRLK